MRSPAPSIRSISLATASLLGLTLLTSLMSLVNIGAMNMVLALVIAAVQASIIALVLMHAFSESPLFRVVLAGGVIWFLILETLTWTDYLTRGWLLPSGK